MRRTSRYTTLLYPWSPSHPWLLCRALPAESTLASQTSALPSPTTSDQAVPLRARAIAAEGTAVDVADSAVEADAVADSAAVLAEAGDAVALAAADEPFLSA